MFRNKTVFILGAGASWHYGYPTGEDLVKGVRKKALQAAEIFRGFGSLGLVSDFPKYAGRNLPPHKPSAPQVKEACDIASRECADLATRLGYVNPPVIDYFLGQNPDLQAIGKLMIAWVILECEAADLLVEGNQNRRLLLRNSPLPSDQNAAMGIDPTKYKDDWYRFVIYKLLTECYRSEALCENNATFVTFNYDTSLEYRLSRGLRSISYLKAADIDRFLTNDRVMHVYGKVHDQPFAMPTPIDFGFSENITASGVIHGTTKRPGPQYRLESCQILDAAYLASKSIRTIDQVDKELDADVLASASAAIEQASIMFILGYGFDGLNNRRLGLERFCLSTPFGERDKSTGKEKCILFTNFLDRNQVNKQASNLFHNRFDRFLPNAPPICGNPVGPFYIEKSTRNVYDALELDFDDLEAQRLFKGPGKRK